MEEKLQIIINLKTEIMNKFKHYRRKQIAELKPFVEGTLLSSSVSISEEDLKAGSPKKGDMIARNPKNHNDQWLVAKQYFEDNFEEIENTEELSLDDDIKCNKQLRVALDIRLQLLKQLPKSRERSLSITKLQESIMWLGMDLKRLNEPNPYPDSYKPENAKIAPTADGMKM